MKKMRKMKGLGEGAEGRQCPSTAGGSCPQGSQAPGDVSENGEVLMFQRALWACRIHLCHSAHTPR